MINRRKPPLTSHTHAFPRLSASSHCILSVKFEFQINRFSFEYLLIAQMSLYTTESQGGISGLDNGCALCGLDDDDDSDKNEVKGNGGKDLIMPVHDEDIVNVDLPPLNSGESLYLAEIGKGLATTFGHIAGSIGKGRRNRTMEYPEERRETIPVEQGGQHVANFRGVHRLNRDEAGRVKCVACFMCPTICPANCIHIVAEPPPWDDREKYPVKFEIDELRCIFCGMCEEACPVDAIELTHIYDLVGLSREEMIFDKEKLLAIYDHTVEKKPV